jgi:hypothetical protein
MCTVIYIIVIGILLFSYVLYLLRQPLWSSGKNFWLQIQRSWFDFRRCPIFWEVVGLERGPLSFVSATEELLERKAAALF